MDFSNVIVKYIGSKYLKFGKEPLVLADYTDIIMFHTV